MSWYRQSNDKRGREQAFYDQEDEYRKSSRPNICPLAIGVKYALVPLWVEKAKSLRSGAVINRAASFGFFESCDELGDGREMGSGSGNWSQRPTYNTGWNNLAHPHYALVTLAQALEAGWVLRNENEFGPIMP